MCEVRHLQILLQHCSLQLSTWPFFLLEEKKRLSVHQSPRTLRYRKPNTVERRCFLVAHFFLYASNAVSYLPALLTVEKPQTTFFTVITMKTCKALPLHSGRHIRVFNMGRKTPHRKH